MRTENLLNILLNALANEYLNGTFADVNEYMDCVRTLKEKFNE